MHPDIAGFQDLAHAFDLKSVRARRAGHPRGRARAPRDPRLPQPQRLPRRSIPPLQVNLVWSPRTGVVREEIPPIPDEIAALMREVSAAGKLVE